MSTYIQNKRIVAQGNANTAADSLKFRAPTRDVAHYNAFFAGSKCASHIGGDAVCNTAVKHNLFAAKMLACNPAATTG